MNRKEKTEGGFSKSLIPFESSSRNRINQHTRVFLRAKGRAPGEITKIDFLLVKPTAKINMSFERAHRDKHKNI